MTTYTAKINLVHPNGRPYKTLSAFFDASHAVGAYVKFDENQIATTTSGTEFIPEVNCMIKDITTDQTAGVSEIESNGRKTGYWLTWAEHSPTNAGRNLNLNAPLSGGKKYKMRMLVAGAA